MESKVKLLGHPIHPILIVFPLGLLAMALLFDLLRIVLGNAELATASYWMIIAGVVMGLVAAVFGFIDWLALPGGTRAKSIGLMHGGGNVVVVVLFLLAWLMRGNEPGHVATTTALILELVGGLIATGTGWLGGELVDRLGVGVDDGANLNAPNSLSGKPASAGTAERMGARPARTR